MTWTPTSSPTRRAAAAPASVAAFTEPTSPRMMAVTRPASTFCQLTSTTFAVFSIASAASIMLTRPRVSIIPSASPMSGRSSSADSFCFTMPCSCSPNSITAQRRPMNDPMNLVVARDATLERILDATFPVWHDGLTRRAYGQLNDAQMRTAWGAANLHRMALVDASGRLLSSAKRYRLTAGVHGRRVRVCGLGAVFTPQGQRGRGYASELVNRLVPEARDEGADLAMLFSEIGPAFYERLSFQPVPLDEVTLAVDRKDGAPAMLVRAGAESDLPALASMHTTRSAVSSFALQRDPSYIQFSLARKRLRAGLAPPGLRQVEFHVAEEGASAVAYVILSVNDHGWTLDEAGDRDPAGARLGAMLQVLAAREPSAGAPAIRGWWPRAFPVPPQIEIVNTRQPRDRLMMRVLGDLPLPGAGDAFYWRGDVF